MLTTSKEDWLRRLGGYLTVRKTPEESTGNADMARVLSVLDLTLLGVGGMLGMGVYIMVGTQAVNVGPAMLISFILAGLASILSAFCYAEFAGRAPGTGSAYAYCYITVGEFIAFLLGWNLVLEFVIGTATLARGLSGYIDALANRKISNTLRNSMPINQPFLSSYPDFFALGIMLVFSGLISIGVKESTMVNNLVVAVNMVTILVLVLVGVMHASTSNWALRPDQVPSKGGNGGFFPYGFGKVIDGTATCFYAYTGFDTIATTGGEAKNARRAIPIALVLSLSLAILVYSLIASTFTLMWPYYDQDTDAPYPYVLNKIGLGKLEWIVSVGATAAITGSTLASTFGMARIVYSIAADGLLFSFLGTVNSRTKTPVAATIVSGLITGLLSIFFDTEQLVKMTSLGTLMAYTMVAMCVLLLRYEPLPDKEKTLEGNWKSTFRGSALSLRNLLNTSGDSDVSKQTFQISNYAIGIFVFFSFVGNIILAPYQDLLIDLNPVCLVILCVAAVFMLSAGVVLQRQPKEKAYIPIKVKPVPLLPLVTIFVNVHLMLRLSGATWIRFMVWLAIGLLIYFLYGIWHSNERPRRKPHLEPTTPPLSPDY